MNPTLKNILAVILGLVLGGIVNEGLIMIGPSVIAPPDGADMKTIEGLKASMHLLETKHFLFPFLAHALGTFVGAYIAARLAASRHLVLALVVGAFFLAGGISAVFMLPSPLWFTLVDLILAYIPMAYIAGKLATARK